MFLDPSWCQLSWTTWIPFTDRLALRAILTNEAGLYRIKSTSQHKLFYIGQTRRLLARMLSELIPSTLQEQMPFNDPHTAAQSLWVWRVEQGLEYELSVARSDLPDCEREGLECFLIWQYRKEAGETTQCNLGRFHPRYQRSSNRKLGIRGGLLPEGSINPASGPCCQPLQDRGEFLNNDWMGLDWSPAYLLNSTTTHGIPTVPGVYKIFSPESRELLYIGQSANLQYRLSGHARKDWQTEDACFSFHQTAKDVLSHQLHEIENDLIASFFGKHQTVPKFQFVNLS